MLDICKSDTKLLHQAIMNNPILFGCIGHVDRGYQCKIIQTNPDFLIIYVRVNYSCGASHLSNLILSSKILQIKVPFC